MCQIIDGNWILCSEMRQYNQRRQDVSGRRRYLLASNTYCIRASAVSGTVMVTVGQVTGTASELVLLQVQ